ncbi:MAG TPA: hypothetical protein VGG89_02060 [Candidatus Baltobacteraceae bacterium]|jgi:hypothetical protein
MTWIYALPAWLFFVVVLVALTVASAAGLFVFQRVVPQNDELAHNDVAGPIIGTIGTILAVVLSFLLIGNWQEYDGAAATVAQEASSVGDLYHSAAYFPPATATQLRSACRTYVDVVIGTEWPAMRRGQSSPQALQAALHILEIVARYEPKTAAQQALQQSDLALANAIMDGRRTRLFDNEEGIPMLFWAGNFFIAAITIVFCYLFRVRKRWLHVFMTTGLMAVIATLFVVTAEFDYPFRGDGQIQPFPFTQLRTIMAADLLDHTHGTR